MIYLSFFYSGVKVNKSNAFEYADASTPKVTNITVTDDFVSYTIKITGQGMNHVCKILCLNIWKYFL